MSTTQDWRAPTDHLQNPSIHLIVNNEPDLQQPALPVPTPAATSEKLLSRRARQRRRQRQRAREEADLYSIMMPTTQDGRAPTDHLQNPSTHLIVNNEPNPQQPTLPAPTTAATGEGLSRRTRQRQRRKAREKVRKAKTKVKNARRREAKMEKAMGEEQEAVAGKQQEEVRQHHCTLTDLIRSMQLSDHSIPVE